MSCPQCPDRCVDLAEGLSAAFAKAGPDDEIVAAAFPEDKRLGIFTEDRVTSFQAIGANEGAMVLSFFAVEEVPEEPGVVDEAAEYKIPGSIPERSPRFRVVPTDSTVLLDARTLEVDWRSSYFRRAIRLSPGGFRRRTVLMELPPEEEDPEQKLRVPREFTDAQMRALDKLDAARRDGLVTEREFQKRRRQILQGRLEEAGYGDEAP